MSPLSDFGRGVAPSRTLTRSNRREVTSHSPFGVSRTHCPGMAPSPTASVDRVPEFVASPLQLRRAVLAVLLDAAGPLRLTDIVTALDREHGIDLGVQWQHARQVRSIEQRLSDLVRWQVRAGRVRRVARATFVASPTAMSSSTQWRCRNWRRIADAEVRGR